MVMVRSAVKKNQRKSQREAARLQKQADAVLAMEEDEEVHFKRPDTVPDTPRVLRTNSPDREEEDDREVKDYTAVLEMVKTVRDRLTALVLDNANIRAACDDLRRQCHSQGVAFGDLSRLVKQSREDQEESRADTWEETRPHPRIRPELLDGGGNLRARDIGITWQDGDTFLHGVRIIGQRDDMEDNRRRPATAAPYPSCPEEMEDARRQPAMSTPYQQSHGHPSGDTSTPGFPRPVCIEMSDTPAHHFAGPRQEGRPAHRPAAPIQRFYSKSIGWPAWFRHFRAVADVQGWDKDQRALQMVSYLDEKAMNVAQELSDVLGSVLPHTLDIKNGLLFAQGGASLQLHRRDSALSGRVFTVGHSSIPPYSEAVLHCSVRTTGGRALPSSGLLEGLTLFAEETGLIVGRTLVDPLKGSCSGVKFQPRDRRSEPLHRSGNDRPGDRHTVGDRRPDTTSGCDRRATPSFTGSG